jgi:glycerol-3-phosphate dehydrogenase
MARTVEDVLARRIRALFLNAGAAVAMAARVAELMAVELGRDAAWQARTVSDFNSVARQYLLDAG